MLALYLICALLTGWDDVSLVSSLDFPDVNDDELFFHLPVGDFLSSSELPLFISFARLYGTLGTLFS